MRFLTITRYPGQVILDTFIPIVFAAMPILLGRASGAENAAIAFQRNTGTANYVAYLLIGSSVFTIVSFAFWHIAYWLRWEQESGTLEALYLAPVHRIWIAAGTALYSCGRALFAALTAYFLGALILRFNPLQGELGLALLFILVGFIPLYGLTLLYGAVILKVKEANALVNLMQWAVSFLMGVFFPITVFPPLLKAVALLFPPTWMTNGVRSALLGIGFFLGKWYLDLAVLWSFMLITPLLGYWVFRQVENNVRRNEGVGQF
ncbi:MAG: ABC-type multidrug transport system, permease component [Anaerolineae bacterium]|nr:MAG: ABC-type multidrug transport system, permease component [Anaerolineae bacterium]